TVRNAKPAVVREIRGRGVDHERSSRPLQGQLLVERGLYAELGQQGRPGGDCNQVDTVAVIVALVVVEGGQVSQAGDRLQQQRCTHCLGVHVIQGPTDTEVLRVSIALM